MTTTRDPAPTRDDGAAAGAVPLGPAEWCVALALVVATLVALSWWDRAADAPPRGVDARIPFAHSGDGVAFARAARAAVDAGACIVLGDSFVQGAYVRSDETLPVRLARRGGRPCANLGFQGAHPAALLGMVRHHGGAIENAAVLLHCNLLWLSSPRHDLSDDKEASFHHPDLVAQFDHAITVYRADFDTRLGRAIAQRSPVAALARHWQLAHLDGLDAPSWTLANPRRLWPATKPAAWTEPAEVPQPWTERGMRAQSFDWVPLERSVQWRCFRDLVERLRSRGNRVTVIVGPFNEAMLTDAGRAAFEQRRDGVLAWCRANGVPAQSPPPPPSDEWADASHPLAAGYASIAAGLDLPR